MSGIEELAPRLIFYFFAALMVGGGALVVSGKNLIHSAFALLLSFFGVAVFYVLLGADFLAGAQVLIYVGGILILMLFGVMLTQRIYDLRLSTETHQRGPALMVAGAIFATLTVVAYRTPWAETPVIVEEPTTKALGQLFLTDYVLPFEVASVLLLVALMGAAMLVRKRTDW
jgi:NADH-quinone oxidoreductase subunit J